MIIWQEVVLSCTWTFLLFNSKIIDDRYFLSHHHSDKKSILFQFYFQDIYFQMYEKLLILKRSILPTENPLEKQVCPRPGVMIGRMQPILEDVGDNFGRVPCPDGLLWGSGFDIIATCVLRCLTTVPVSK